MATLFVSDLHLSPARPAIIQAFFDFLSGPAARASSLYVLGDLFDYWAGDDDLDDPFNASVVNALRALSARGVALYLMHGNRDFLIGAAFVEAAGAKLLTDPTLIKLHGTPTLLTHGDALCTGDTDYQAFRGKVRALEWQAEFLSQALSARKAAIAQLHARSERDKRTKPAQIMDVAPSAVAILLRAHGFPRLIHGHTHRPALHVHEVDGHRCERWVLADWYERGSYLRCDATGCAAVSL